MKNRLARQYVGVYKGLLVYWQAYGGIRALISSPFLHCAIILTMACTPIWWAGAWWERSLSIIPSILGFSIAGFTLVLGIGDESFRTHLGIRRLGSKQSTLTGTSSGFFHFILVQVVAVALALIAASKPLSFALNAFDIRFSSLPLNAQIVLTINVKIFRAIGFLALAYTMTTAIASTLNVFRLATIFSQHVTERASRARTTSPAPRVPVPPAVAKANASALPNANPASELDTIGATTAQRSSKRSESRKKGRPKPGKRPPA